MPLKRGSPGFRDNPQAIAAEALTVTNGAAVGLASLPAQFDFAFIEVQDEPVRIRFDGTDPTTSVGHFYVAGASDVLGAREVRAMKAIGTAAANATIFATYYKEMVVP